MRQTFLALAVAAIGGFALANCGNSSNNNSDMGKDMAGSGGAQDMTVGKLNCLGVGYCLATCTSPDINTCVAQCQKQTTQTVFNLFAAAFNCGQKYCAPDPDAGTTGSCVRTCNPAAGADPNDCYFCAAGQTYDQCKTNMTANACTMCLDNAVGTPLLGDGTTPPTGMCTDEAAPSCRGGTACTTAMNACINNK